ncbi:MAG TPA: DEAD/DEAH box helicase [Pseudomonadota bacterium]|nr:DEAD/DEAH box helicase [Pseudomonadota bacterium]
MAVAADLSDSGLSLFVTPTGQLQLTPESAPGAAESVLNPQLAQRLRKAHAAGLGEFLLHLGTTELATTLPPDFAFFRELCRRFLTALCATPDLEEQRARVTVPLPADLGDLAGTAPPMRGAEYLDGELLGRLWDELLATVRAELAAATGSVQEYLAGKNRLWNLVGRVCFHLVENKRNPEVPFAFLATYASRLSGQAQVAHLPLGKALAEYSEGVKKDKGALLALLAPVQKAASKSPFVRKLVDSGELFQPLGFTPAEAYAFLKDVPALEESGVVVRVPDFWQARKPPRPQVSVTIGKNAAATLSADALLDFSISLTVDGQPISDAEWQEILRGSDGLALIKGRWVEVDRDKLGHALSHWQSVQEAAAQGELSFVQAMRLLAGAAVGETATEVLTASTAQWSQVIAGDFLAAVLAGLGHPDSLGPADPGPELRATLRPYQQVGVKWLYLLDQLGLGGCLADDMGLGKTIQVLALLLLKRRARQATGAAAVPSLLVVPASLLGNWQAELRRFAPSLRVLIAHPSAVPGAELAELGPAALGELELCITSYGSVVRYPVFAQSRWDLVILDEAQAIKNPAAKQTRAVKALRSRTRLLLSGTPVENRLADLWSLYDFICPGLLGSAKVFSQFTRRLAEKQDYGPLRRLIGPYLLRRLKSDKRIISDLPDKTELVAYCGLSKRQAVLYEQAVAALREQLTRVEEDVQRRGVILSFLLRFKQLCNHPSQWLGDGVYDPQDSGKFARLRELCEPIASRQERVLVFTQFRELTAPLAEFLRGVFGQPGLVLHGETPVKNRPALVQAFQKELGPPFFVLSLKAGGTGLNLTAASHVIHFDRWWNPAVESQASDRAYRIGQKKNVLIHKFVCRGTVEERIDSLIAGKQELAHELLTGGGEALLTQLKDEELLRMVALDINSALPEG